MPLVVRLFKGLLFVVIVGPLLLGVILQPGYLGWLMYLFLTVYWWITPLAFLGPRGSRVALILWVVVAAILKLIFGHTERGRRWVESNPRSTAWSSGGGGGRRSSRGGFSGGGGSFGGGGASGSW